MNSHHRYQGRVLQQATGKVLSSFKMSSWLSYSQKTKLSLVSEITVNRLKENTPQTKQFSKEPIDDMFHHILLVALVIVVL